ncbi:MAG TPA: IclR family transcriptional regulator [Gaiellaceae bacterium]|jgi:DNA-binding IclR family transcriptional regulator|nr:IclR family transcriptional regulator [Gaiellaceae bacterium]
MSELQQEAVGYQTRSLIRALAILDSFGPDEPTLSVKDLHERLGVPKPTISRLASVLEKHGLLRGAGHGYRLGPKTFELGALFARQYGLQSAARPPLEAMARETSQTSSLAVLSSASVVYLIVARPLRPIHHVTDAGSRELAHLTGLGKALLSTLEPAAVERLLGPEPLESQTPHTLTDYASLHEELELTRNRGYALDEEEFALGLRCVAIQLELPRVGLAAISVSGPAADYASSDIPAFVEILRQTAAELEAAFAQAAEFSFSPAKLGEQLPRVDVDSR